MTGGGGVLCAGLGMVMILILAAGLDMIKLIKLIMYYADAAIRR